MAFWIVLICVVALAAYFRLAPTDPAVWHEMPAGATESQTANSVTRTVAAGADGLGRLDRIIRHTPRTRHLAGSLEQGTITYVTRSAVFGFPDYTTVLQNDDGLTIYGRARFGHSDFGVNRTRVEGWIKALETR